MGTSKQQEAAVVSYGSHAPPTMKGSSTETIHTTQSHPWLTTKGWIKADELHLGDHVLRLDGTTAQVTKLYVIPGAQNMWDLTVSNVHTFAVGQGLYVVHNCIGQVASAMSQTLQEQVPESAQGYVTTAVGVFKDPATGNLKPFASMSGSYLSGAMRVRAVAAKAEQLGAIFLEGAGHAEVNILKHPLTQGLDLVAMAPSRPFCIECALATVKTGGTNALVAPIRNDLSAFPYYDFSKYWYTPSGLDGGVTNK